MVSIGRKTWAIAGGHIPFGAAGPEPEHTCREELAVLNTGEEDARLELTVYFSDRPPVGAFRLEVAAQRVRTIRMNDLIDPEAIPLDTDYGLLVRSNVPIILQFSRIDSRQPGDAGFSVIPYSEDE